MCYGATCGVCSGKSWSGCGNHVPNAMSGVPEDQWCKCEPKVNVNGKDYPPAAKSSGGWFGGSRGSSAKKDENKGEL